MLVLVAGCGKSLETGARESFAREYSCPEERVSVRARPDVEAAEILLRAAPQDPPAAVSEDPARLAKWEQDRADAQAKQHDGFARFEVFEVSGCDTTQLVACHHPPMPNTRGKSKRLDEVVCLQSRSGDEREERQQDKEQRKRDKAQERARKDEERALERDARAREREERRRARDGVAVESPVPD